MSNFKDLLVWQRADEFAFQVYRLTRGFPKDELYGLTSQLRRSAVSISTNLAEGSGRQHRNETRQFANIALGSLAEAESRIGFAKRLEFFSDEEFGILDGLRKEVAALLWRSYKNL